MSQRNLYFIHGSDTFASSRSLKVVEQRFRHKENSMADFSILDMEQTSFESLQATILTTPFFVTHRLFILKHIFSAPKATQEGLLALLPKVSESTFVVLYEGKSCDKRLGLYKWLVANAKNEEHITPEGRGLTDRIHLLAKAEGVVIEPSAAMLLASQCEGDTWRLGLEVQKLACAAHAQSREAITVGLVEELGSGVAAQSLFALTDAIRDGEVKKSLLLCRSLLPNNDPMLLAGTIGSQIRTLAKISVAKEKGVTSGEGIAKTMAINPYVVKLALPTANRLSLERLRAAYRALLSFDRGVKEGRFSGQLGILLLILTLHGTLKK